MFLLVASSFPINTTLNPLHHNPRPLSHSLSRPSLCVAASSQKCLILPLSGVQQRSEDEGQPFSLSSFSSAVPLLRLPALFKAALFFSFHLLSFFPHLFGFPFFLACGIALALPSTGRRVKYPSPVNFKGENSPSASPVFIALSLCRILDFSPLFTFQSVSFTSWSLSCLSVYVLNVRVRGSFTSCKIVVIKGLCSCSLTQ